MLALEVKINGVRRCIAGSGDMAVLTAILDWVGNRDPTRVSIAVGGLQHPDPTGERHVDWLKANLGTGDEVTIRVVEVSAGDAPTHTGRRIEAETCSFCGLHRSRVEKIVAGAQAYICSNCVAAFHESITSDKAPPDLIVDAEPEQHCSFCWKTRSSVRYMFRCADACICAECVSTCVQIVSGDEAS